MKKNLPLILGIVLFIAGLGTLAKSIPAGLLTIIAALIILPASKNFLIQKLKPASILSNQFVSYGLAFALLAISAPVVDWSERNALVNKFNTDNALIIKEISDFQEKKQFSRAEIVISKYLKVMPSNVQLIGLKKENDAKELADKELKAAKKLAEEEAENAKRSTPSDGSIPGAKYVLNNTTTGRSDNVVYQSYGACSQAQVATRSTDWKCFARAAFANEK
jgi:hypothetical protein